jgi:hypothetical protein
MSHFSLFHLDWSADTDPPRGNDPTILMILSKNTLQVETERHLRVQVSAFQVELKHTHTKHGSSQDGHFGSC